MNPPAASALAPQPPAGQPPAAEPSSDGAPASNLSAVLESDARAVVIAIPASPEFVRVVRLAVAGVATRMRFSYEQIEDIKLAVSEACNNAILHASPPGGSVPTQVVVRLLPADETLEITVFDQGRLSEPGLSLPDSGAEAGGVWQGLDDLPEGGMGLVLIQSLMDEVSSQGGAHSHTALRMVKRTRAF
jgi:serine/threonine-protein kinase RsbW